MICRSCTERTHFACEYPKSCCCSHKSSWPDGEVDQWSYTALPTVFDNGSSGWVWKASHPEGDLIWFDRQGRRCTLRPGKTGIRLFYRAVDFRN